MSMDFSRIQFINNSESLSPSFSVKVFGLFQGIFFFVRGCFEHMLAVTNSVGKKKIAG